MTELNLAKTTQNRVIVKVASFTCGITTAQEKKTCIPVRLVPEVIGLKPHPCYHWWRANDTADTPARAV